MKSQYKNTIFLCLLLCLFITFASATSVIRQFTDDFNTNLQQEEVSGPISSSDNIVSNTLTGLRNRVPSSYSLKMQSFNTLLQSSTQRHIARPFSAGGYNWTLSVYPNGNYYDGGSGYISLYVTIDSRAFATGEKDIYADLRFYIFNNNEKKYFTIQATDVWRFNNFKQMWGFSKVLPVSTFKDPKNGYLYDGDHCEFGVDVIVPTRFETSELLTIAKSFPIPKFTWTLRRFSTLDQTNYYSDMFTIGGRRFYLIVGPSGTAGGEGKSFSMFLVLSVNQKTGVYEEVYIRAKLRVLNQRNNLKNVEKPIDYWYGLAFYNYGEPHFMPLTELRDPSKGFIVNDVLIVEVEFQAISNTTYFP